MHKYPKNLLEKYIEGKDQDKFEILEEIYLPNAQVAFEIQTDTISFPSEGLPEVLRRGEDCLIDIFPTK